MFRSAYFPIPHRPTFGAPVFHSAYSASRNTRASAAFAASIKPHRALFFKTLDLQPLRGLRWAGGLRAPLAAHRIIPSGYSGVPVGLFSDSAPTHLRCAGVPLGLFGKPKRSSFSRVRGLHQATPCSFLQNARPPAASRPSVGGGPAAPLHPLLPPPRCRVLLSGQEMALRRRTDGKAERLASCAVSFFRRKAKPLASGAPKAPPVPPWFLPRKG